MEDFGGVLGLRATYKEEASLLVRNSGNQNCGFAICTRCGFAMSEEAYGRGRINLPNRFDQHASIFNTDPNGFCWVRGETDAPVLRNKVLAVCESTDMLLIEWPGATTANNDGTYSLGRAMVLAGVKTLELDERELGMVLLPLQTPSLGIVIYDTAPGGAGHCLELYNRGSEWVEQTGRTLFVNSEHDANCNRACLDCILDFSGQYQANKLNRREALRIIDAAKT